MLPLYAIVDVEVCLATGREPDEVTRQVAAAGVSHVQLRAKPLGGAAMLALAERLLAITMREGSTLIVNDRVDVARTIGAGVHLGQDDLPVAQARALLGPHAIIGRSTHTLDELDRALAESISYVAYGPVFATTTKANPDPVVGLDGVAAAARRARAAGLPLVAIGGITLATARAVRTAGADAVAVISDLTRGPDTPADRARRFLSALRAEPV
jgi:thiamine-phosphate pyrophosphorylase